MSMKDARAKELDFFHKKAEYSGLRNIGTGFLSTELSEKLITSVRRQLPNISGFVNKSVMDLKKELEAMGGPAATSRGEMIHLVLTLCRKFETSFAKLIDGGKGGAPTPGPVWGAVTSTSLCLSFSAFEGEPVQFVFTQALAGCVFSPCPIPLRVRAQAAS
jgi:hypothetical protein